MKRPVTERWRANVIPCLSVCRLFQ